MVNQKVPTRWFLFASYHLLISPNSSLKYRYPLDTNVCQLGVELAHCQSPYGGLGKLR